MRRRAEGTVPRMRRAEEGPRKPENCMDREMGAQKIPETNQNHADDIKISQGNDFMRLSRFSRSTNGINSSE
jgi:hypothetical protein